MKKGPFPKLNLTNQTYKKAGTAESKAVQKLKLLRAELKKNPNKEYHPAEVAYFTEIPAICPYDKEELLHLTNIQKQGLNIHEGDCCITCSRLFLKVKKKAVQPTFAKPGVSVVPQAPVSKTAQPKASTYSGMQTGGGGVHFLQTTEGLPASTILVAKLESYDQKITGSVAIVADSADQKSEMGIYWVGRALASAILAAIQTDQRRRLDYKGHWYHVVSYHAYRDAQKYLNIIARFCNPVAPQDVYVFAHKNVSHFDADNYEMVSAMVPCANKKLPVPISVYYDKVKRMYFINETSYIEARQKYGLPYMRLRMTDQNDGKATWLVNLKQHSELYLLGYSVSSTEGLSEEARRALLSQAIDSGVLTKGEIINHLEWLVKTHDGKDLMVNAVGEWKSDLSFVQKYQVQKQRQIWIAAFKSKYSGVKKV